ncbi:hypothetical protein [Paenibacillus sp. CF384]|uniref:hypothetical protein n=1 Tax=Paenibacillus sp. CF384 TaxID=1884382 RepID=UPI001C42FFEF|nr:hypothetical protein [Paenibacillus sp. CF384]
MSLVIGWIRQIGLRTLFVRSILPKTDWFAFESKDSNAAFSLQIGLRTLVVCSIQLADWFAYLSRTQHSAKNRLVCSYAAFCC